MERSCFTRTVRSRSRHHEIDLEREDARHGQEVSAEASKCGEHQVDPPGNAGDERVGDSVKLTPKAL